MFLQVRNRSGAPRRSARSIVLIDRHGHATAPVGLPRANAYAYRPAVLAPGETVPAPLSPAASSPEQGSLVLFRLDRPSSRALRLRITAPGDAAAGSVQLAAPR